MEIFSIDQITVIHRWTRLLPAIFGILTAVIAVFNIYLTDRISSHKKEEDHKTKARLEAAEKQLISTQTIADTAQEAAEKLKEAARPRHLTPEQVSNITAYLKDSNKYTVALQCITNNTEAWQFAEQVKTTFESGGFSFPRIDPVITIPPLKGIKIKTKIQFDKGMDKALAEFLRSQNQPLNVEKAVQGTADITIQIGQKN